MTDFTQDDLKHVYNKNDLLSFAKEYWGDAFDRAIELGYDEDKANQFVYGVMREYAFNETDKEGNLLVDKYPLRQIPTWEDFGGKDTVTRGRVSQYSQNPQDLVDIQFKANEIDDLLADKTTYEPNGLINSFTKNASKLFHGDDDAQKMSQMWMLNNANSGLQYYLKHGTYPFPQAENYDPGVRDAIAQFFSTFMEFESGAGMLVGSSIGRGISTGLGKYGGRKLLEHSPKTLTALGYTFAYKDALKNRLKKKIGMNYKDVSVDKLGGLKTREDLIERGVDAISRNASHFGSWYGFTFYSGFTQDLLKQKMQNMQDGNPDKPLDNWSALSSGHWHSSIEGAKGMFMGYPMHKLSKIYRDNQLLTGGHRNSIGNIFRNENVAASWKTLASGPLPKFGTETFTLTALTELQHGIQRTSEGQDFFDWDEIEKQGGFFRYANKHLLTNAGILLGFKGTQLPYTASSKFIEWQIGKRIKQIQKDIDVEIETLKQLEKVTDITDVEGNRVKLDIDNMKDLRNSILEKKEHVAFLKLQKMLGKDINPYSDSFYKTVEEMIKDPEMKAQETLQSISEFWTANRHRVETLLEDPKAFRKEVKEYLKEEYGEGVEISDKLVDNTVNMLKSSIETTSKYIDMMHEKKLEQGEVIPDSKPKSAEYLRKEGENLKSEIISRDKNRQTEIETLDKALAEQKITQDAYNGLLEQMLLNVDKVGNAPAQVKVRTEQEIRQSQVSELDAAITELAALQSKLTGRNVTESDIRNNPDYQIGQGKLIDPNTKKPYLSIDAMKRAIEAARKEVDVEPTQKRDQDLAVADFDTIKKNKIFDRKIQKLKKSLRDYIEDSVKNGEMSKELANELYYGINKYLSGEKPGKSAPGKMQELVDYVKFLHSKGIKSLSDTTRDLTTEYIESQGARYESQQSRNLFNNIISSFFGTGTESSYQKTKKGWAYDYMGTDVFSPSISEIGVSRKTKAADIADVGGTAPTMRQKLKNTFNKIKDALTVKDRTHNNQEMSVETYDLAENLLYVLGSRSPLIFRYLRVDTIDWVNGKIKEVKTGAGQKGLENLTNYPMRELHPEIWKKMQDAKGNRPDNSKELLLLDVNGKPFKTTENISVGREIINKINSKIIANSKGVKFYGGKDRVSVQDYRRMILTDASRIGGESLRKIIDKQIVKHSTTEDVGGRYDLTTQLGRENIKKFYQDREKLDHAENIIELHGGVGITPKLAKEIIDIGKKALVRTVSRLGELNKKKNIGPVGFRQEVVDNNALYTLAAFETLSKVMGKTNEFKNFESQIVIDIPVLNRIKNKSDIIKTLYDNAKKFESNPEKFVKSIKNDTRTSFFRYLRDIGVNTKDKQQKSDAILDIINSLTDKQIKRFDNYDNLIEGRLSNDKTTINDAIEFNMILNQLSPIKKMSAQNKNIWNKKQRNIKSYTKDFNISENEMINILSAFGVPKGTNLNETIRRATSKQLEYAEDYILSSRFKTEPSPLVEAAIKDIDSYLGTDFTSRFKRFKSWGMFKNDALRKLGFNKLANQLELYGAVMEKHRGRIEDLESNLLNIYSSVKTVDGQGKVTYTPTSNPAARQVAKALLNKYKDIMAAVTDPEIAKWIMTSESKLKEGELFIDVYAGKDASNYKFFIEQAYDKNFKLRTDTIEGRAVSAVRSYYAQYKQLLGDIAKRVLTAKQYKEFVDLYGPNGQKWLDAYGARRLSPEMLKHYRAKAGEKGNPHDIIFEDITYQEIGKILVKEHKKGKADVEKMSNKELAEWADKHTIDGVLVRNIAETKALKRVGHIFNMDTNRITASPLMSRAKGEIEFSYVTGEGKQAKAYKRLLQIPEELPTYDIGKGAFDNVVGGYNYTMAKLLSGLEFFKEFVHIEGVSGMSGRGGMEILAKEIRKGNLKDLDPQTIDFVLNSFKDLFDFGNPNSVGDYVRRKTLPLVAIPGKAQLSTPLIHGFKNAFIGQVMNLAATPEGFNYHTMTKFLNSDYRAEVRKAGLTGAGTRIYDINVPTAFKQILDIPFALGGTRAFEFYNRYTTDAITLQAVDYYVNQLKASKATNIKGPKVNIAKARTMLKSWYNLNKKQIELLETYGVHTKDVSELIKMPEFMKIKDKQQRIDTAWDYANTIQKIRVLGGVRTQGTTSRAFTPRILDNSFMTNALLFKKMAAMGTLSSFKMMNMGWKYGGVAGMVPMFTRMFLGNVASGYMLENMAHYMMGREFSYQDEDMKRVFFYAFRGEMFSMAGEAASWAFGINDRTRLLDFAPIGFGSDIVGLAFDSADLAFHPKQYDKKWSELMGTFAKNQSGLYRFFDANIERLKHPYKKQGKDIGKRYYEWQQREGNVLPTIGRDFAPIYEQNDLGRYGYVSGNRFNGTKKIQQAFEILDDKSYWRVDTFSPLKFKRQIRDIFQGADFNNFDEVDNLKRTMGMYLTAQMVDYTMRDEGVITDPEEAWESSMKALYQYLSPDNLTGLDGLHYEQISSKNTKRRYYPSDEKGKDGKPLYFYPKILMPLRNEKGQYISGDLGRWYETEIADPSEGTKKSMFWDYYEDAPDDVKKELVEHLLESQDRIKEFYKYLYTSSGMMDIVYNKKTGEFHSNNPLHKKLDLNQINEAYDIQKILFDGNMDIDPGQREKILLSRMRTNINKKNIASEAEKKRLLKEISDIDKELKKLGVNPIVY